MSKERCQRKEYHVVEDAQDYYCYWCNKTLSIWDEFKLLHNEDDTNDKILKSLENKDG